MRDSGVTNPLDQPDPASSAESEGCNRITSAVVPPNPSDSYGTSKPASHEIPTLNSGQMLRALAIHFDWFQNRIMPEWSMGGRYWNRRGNSRADLVILTKSHYLTEVEIKVTRSDWNADRLKDKWRQEYRPHVSRFFYAVTPLLAESVPDWVPSTAGILVVNPGNYVKELRAARRVKAAPVSEETVRRMYEACYFRYWRDRLKSLPRADI